MKFFCPQKINSVTTGICSSTAAKYAKSSADMMTLRSITKSQAKSEHISATILILLPICIKKTSEYEKASECYIEMAEIYFSRGFDVEAERMKLLAKDASQRKKAE